MDRPDLLCANPSVEIALHGDMAAGSRPPWMKKVDPYVHGFNPLFLATLLVSLAVFVYLFLPDLLGQRGPKTRCISNLKQLSTSLHIYADAHDQRMPASEWADVVNSYAQDWELHTCDKVKARRLKWGYAFNWSFLGVETDEVTDPSKSVLLFETDALAKSVIANLAALGTPRHGDRVIVSFFDTSTKARLPQEVRSMGP